MDSENGALVVITWWDTCAQAQGGHLSSGEAGGVAAELPEIYEVIAATG